jgi:hypothetical protein
VLRGDPATRIADIENVEILPQYSDDDWGLVRRSVIEF